MKTVFAYALLVLSTAYALGEMADAAQSGAIDIRPLDQNPILRVESAGRGEKGVLAGPSVLRVPDWVTNRLGRYYMYYALRDDLLVRLAYADAVEGPWAIHAAGVLGADQLVPSLGSFESGGYISMPEIIVDEDQRRMRLYFTFRSTGQVAATSVALSSDGLHFEPQPTRVEADGLRAFRWGPHTLFLDGDGGLWRSADGLQDFEKGGRRFGEALADAATGATYRRGCFVVRGWTGWLFFSREGDRPESLFFTSVCLFGEARDWTPEAPVVALAGEGDDMSDPFYLEDGGRAWLFYVTGGGAGIAAAELKEP